MLTFLALLAAMELERCSISHTCFNGTTISCTAEGFGTHCDANASGVHCEYWDENGQKVVVNKYCGAETKGGTDAGY